MEVGCPQSLQTPYAEIVFNDLSGTARSLSGHGGSVFPGSLPPGNGYLLSFVGGMEGAPLRHPVTNLPHAHGGVRHRFRRGAKIIRIEGQIVATTREYRRILDDWLMAALDSILQRDNNLETVDRRYYWTPPGMGTRLLHVNLYEMPQLIGAPSAAPKTFQFSLVSGRSEAIGLNQPVTALPNSVPKEVANDGNTATWPNIKVYPELIVTYAWTLLNGEGYALQWDGVPYPGRSYIEINMWNQTMYWDGNREIALDGLDMAESDFWSIPPGGTTVEVRGATGTLIANDAWV